MPTAHQVDNGVAKAQSRYSAASVSHTSSVLSRRLRERRLLRTGLYVVDRHWEAVAFDRRILVASQPPGSGFMAYKKPSAQASCIWGAS